MKIRDTGSIHTFSSAKLNPVDIIFVLTFLYWLVEGFACTEHGKKKRSMVEQEHPPVLIQVHDMSS